MPGGREMSQWCCWSILPAVLFVGAIGQELPTVERVMPLTAADSVFCLGVPFIQTLTLLLDSLYTLQTPLDYEVEARHGCVRLSFHFRRLFRYRDTVRLWVMARYIPLFVQARGAEALLAQAQRPSAPSPIQERESARTEVGIQRQGHLVRGFTLQTGSGLTLYSGLELGFHGSIAQQTELGGRISAEHLPLTTDGSIIPLTDADRLALYVRSPTFQAEAGQLPAPPLIRTSTGIEQLSGVEATARFGRGELSALLGTAAARTATVVLHAIDGLPGPYRVREPSNGASISIVPGSERVWVNGVLQEQGEDKDYVIDYWRAEITFRPRRPVSARSHIVVEYAFVEDDCTQMIAALAFRSTPGETHKYAAGYTHRFINPLQGSSPPPDGRLTVRQGGGYALVDGATWVGVDSVSGYGRGWYRKRDTTEGGVPWSIWQYAPGAPDAVYMVQFSFVGYGRGDYEKAASGAFRYVGRRKGSYAPVRFLPLPSQQQRWDLRWEWYPQGRWYTVWTAHLARVQPYRSRTAWLYGGGVSLQTRYSTDPDTTQAWFLWQTHTDWRAVPWEEPMTSEAEQRAFAWNLPRMPEQPGRRVVLGQRFRLQRTAVRGETSIGWLYSGDSLNALRWGHVLEVMPQKSFRATLTYSGGIAVYPADIRGRWHRLYVTGSIDKQTWQWQGEWRLEWQSLLTGTRSQNTEGKVSVLWYPSSSWTIEFQFPWRWERETDAQWWQPAVWLRWLRKPGASQLRIGWNALQQIHTNSSLPLLLWQGRWEKDSTGSIRWLYESGVELSGSSTPMFLRVMPGQGSYRYRGDLNGNGVAEPSEFEPVPVGGDHLLVPVTSRELVPGSSLRAEAAWMWTIPSVTQRRGQWEGRVALVQRRHLPSRWWETLLPRSVRDTAVMMTRWAIEQHGRLFGISSEGGVRGEWSGVTFWTGLGWELRDRAMGELYLQAPVAPVLRIAIAAGPVWETLRSVYWQGREAALRAVQSEVELVWQPSQAVTLTPQFRLLYGKVVERRGVRVVNLCGMLAMQFRPAQRWTAGLNVRYGALMSPLASQALMSLGTLQIGGTVSGSIQYQARGSVWLLQYQATKVAGYSLWHALNGQVHLLL